MSCNGKFFRPLSAHNENPDSYSQSTAVVMGQSNGYRITDGYLQRHAHRKHTNSDSLQFNAINFRQMIAFIGLIRSNKVEGELGDYSNVIIKCLNQNHNGYIILPVSDSYTYPAPTGYNHGNRRSPRDGESIAICQSLSKQPPLPILVQRCHFRSNDLTYEALMSSRLVRHSSFTHIHTHTLTHTPHTGPLC